MTYVLQVEMANSKNSSFANYTKNHDYFKLVSLQPLPFLGPNPSEVIKDSCTLSNAIRFCAAKFFF